MEETSKDDRITELKVEVFDLMRKIEGIQNILNPVIETKQKRLHELFALEARKAKEGKPENKELK